MDFAISTMWPPNATADSIIPKIVRTEGLQVPAKMGVHTTRNAKLAMHTAKEARLDGYAADATAAAAAAAVAAAVPSSNTSPDVWLKCPTQGCNRICSDVNHINQHLAGNCCQRSGNPTDRNSSAKAAADYDHKSIADMSLAALIDHTAGSINSYSTMGASAAAPTVEGSAKVSLYKFGWGARITLKHPPIDPRIVELAQWAWLYGLKNEAKINPVKFTELLHMFGTPAGMSKFPTEQNWIDAVTKNR
jgi:hypothetical protein